MTNIISDRHPSTQAALRRLEPNPDLPPPAHAIATEFYVLATNLVSELPDDPDLTDCLRKLWEAKNCAVYLAVTQGS